MRWGPISLVRRRRAQTAAARRHLEASRADRPAVERVTRDLHREHQRNNFASRVDASLKGRP